MRAAAKAGGQSLPGEQTMTFHEYLSKAVQDDAQLTAERDRLLLVARRAHRTRRRRAGLVAPARQRLTRLLFRRAAA